MSAPLIGLTADVEGRAAGATEAEFVLRVNYVEAIARAGGVSVILPHHGQSVADVVAALDGIVITGGMFDIDPTYFGGRPDPRLVTKPARTAFEWALLEAALAADLAVLGICNGMQLLAAMMGGRMIKDIRRDVSGGREHLPAPVPDQVAHGIEIAPGSVLSGLHGRDRAEVNSLHHQAVNEAPGYVVSARSLPDRVPEAIEVPGHRFAVGVQWHPEYGTSVLDDALLAAFVEAARAGRIAR